MKQIGDIGYEQLAAASYTTLALKQYSIYMLCYSAAGDMHAPDRLYGFLLAPADVPRAQRRRARHYRRDRQGLRHLEKPSDEGGQSTRASRIRGNGAGQGGRLDPPRGAAGTPNPAG